MGLRTAYKGSPPTRHANVLGQHPIGDKNDREEAHNRPRDMKGLSLYIRRVLLLRGGLSL